MQDEIFKQAIKCEEDVLKNVLKQILGHEPTIDDAKDCQRIMKEGNHEKYIIAYKEIQLGSIRKFFDANTFRVVFTPNDLTL